MSRLTIKGLHDAIGITKNTPGYGEVFGPRSKQALTKFLTNLRAPAITQADFAAAAAQLGVPIKHMIGVRKVEAPRGSYDDEGRVTILYERHKFANNTEPKGKFNKSHPLLSGTAYGPGGYGSFDSQYDKLADACALDPQAAFEACSWGAFQVLGENWEQLKYASVLSMVQGLIKSEAAHLDSFVRYVINNGLVDELRACKPGDPVSCRPFVSRYNGPGYAKFKYDAKLAVAIA